MSTAPSRPSPSLSSPSPETTQQAARLVVVSAGTSQPSTSRMLGDRLAQRTIDTLRQQGVTATVRVVELAPLAVDIARASVSGQTAPLQEVLHDVASADGLVAVTPIFKAGPTGLFKSFLDVFDNDLIVAKPVVLAATAGSPRHALVVDGEIRSVFAYLRALSLPTSVFAAPDDWATRALGERIDRAAAELGAAIVSGFTARVAAQVWAKYQHEYGSRATHGTRDSLDVDVNTSLMRLAAGGRSQDE